ncbi:MAG: tetratricopeptide repeat protein [Endomicrobiales bacterium]|nr:tetratricopeptide repeat protein [Endomicrobiales bacterium]
MEAFAEKSRVFLLNLTKREKTLLLAAALLLVNAVVYYPLLDSSFCNLDDHVLVYANPDIMTFSLDNVKKFFTRPHMGLYHPLVTLSYAVEYRFFKLFAPVYHLTNLFLHMGSTLLVFLIFQAVGGGFFVAFLTATLFAAHPLHVESVAWVSERKDVLYAFFYLFSLLFYLKHAGRPKLKYYLISLFLFIFSLLSKPMAVTLPVILFLADYLINKKFDRRSALEKAPYLALAVVFAAVALLSHAKPRLEAAGLSTYTVLTNAYGFILNVIFYPIKTFWPAKLANVYPEITELLPQGTMHVILYILMFITLVSALAYSFRRSKIVFFGLSWYLLTILPASNIVQFGLGIPADRYSYVPLIGIFFVVSVFLARLDAGVLYKYPLLRKTSFAALASVVLLLALSARERAEVWKDTATLFSDSLSKHETSVAYNNRGVIYHNKGFLDMAISDFKNAIRINPGSPLAYLNLGNAHLNKGNYEEAFRYYKISNYLDPGKEGPFIGISNIYQHLKDFTKAFEYLDRAVELGHESFMIDYNKGSIYAYLKKHGKAESELAAAIEKNPSFVLSYLALAKVYYETGRHAEAAKTLEKAARVDPRDPEICENLAQVYLKLRDYEKLDDTVSRCLRLNPRSDRSFQLRGDAYTELGRYDEAVQQYTQAISINPKIGIYFAKRAILHYNLKDAANARKDALKAKKLGAVIGNSFWKDLKNPPAAREH